jgi:hypothetical protein
MILGIMLLVTMLGFTILIVILSVIVLIECHHAECCGALHLVIFHIKFILTSFQAKSKIVFPLEKFFLVIYLLYVNALAKHMSLKQSLH